VYHWLRLLHLLSSSLPVEAAGLLAPRELQPEQAQGPLVDNLAKIFSSIEEFLKFGATVAKSCH
jgi:hypothetical protein